MMTSIADTLREWNMRPGVTYRTKVNGYTLEFRVVDDDATPTLDVPSLDDQVMMLPWVEIPFFKQGTVIAQPGPIRLSAPPDIPDDEEWS